MILNVLFIAAYVAVICSALLVALLAVKALRYLILYYDDHRYKKQANFIKGEYQRYSAQALLEQFRRNHK